MNEVQTRAPVAPVRADSPRGVLDLDNFDKSWQIACQLAQSELLPKNYRGKPENVILALDIASKLKVSFVQVVQNLVVSEGRPGWLAQFLIAAVNTCGRFTGLRFETEVLDEHPVASWLYEVRQDGSWTKHKKEETIRDKRVRAYAFDASTGERVNGAWVSLAMAHTAGWYTRPDSQWPMMEEQMLMYRAGSFFQRAHAPEVSVGLMSADEVADMAVADKGAAPVPLAETVRAALQSASPTPAAGDDKSAVASTVGTPSGGTQRKSRRSAVASATEPVGGSPNDGAVPAAPHSTLVAPDSGAGDPATADAVTDGTAEAGNTGAGTSAPDGASSAETAAPREVAVPEGCGPLEAAFVKATTPQELTNALSLFKANETEERVQLEQALLSYIEPILASIEDEMAARPLLSVLHGVIQSVVEDRRVRGQLNALYALHYNRLFSA